MLEPGDYDVVEEKRITIKPHEDDERDLSGCLLLVVGILAALSLYWVGVGL